MIDMVCERVWLSAATCIMALFALAMTGCTTKEPGHIVALDLDTGEELWRVGGQPAFIHDTLIYGGRLFVLGGDGCRGDALAAYDTATGTQSWRQKLKGDCRLDTMLLLPDEGLIVLPARGGVVFRAEDGDARRSRSELSTRDERYVAGQWLMGGTLFLDSTYEPTHGRVRSITVEGRDPKTAALKWRADLGPGSFVNLVTMDQDTVLFEVTESHLNENEFVVTTSSTLFGVDATSGQVLWRDHRSGEEQLAALGVHPSLPYVQRGELKEWLEVIDPRSGAVRWRTEETGRHIGVAASGEITVITMDGKVHAYQTDSGALLWRRSVPQWHFAEAHPLIVDGVVYVAIEGHIIPFW
jgi:outer membrane protein assembly factor BamB